MCDSTMCDNERPLSVMLATAQNNNAKAAVEVLQEARELQPEDPRRGVTGWGRQCHAMSCAGWGRRKARVQGQNLRGAGGRARAGVRVWGEWHCEAA